MKSRLDIHTWLSYKFRAMDYLETNGSMQVNHVKLFKGFINKVYEELYSDYMQRMDLTPKEQ